MLLKEEFKVSSEIQNDFSVFLGDIFTSGGNCVYFMSQSESEKFSFFVELAQ